MHQSFETQGDRDAGPARLAALRARMAEAGVHGFLVPRGDAHMGETVAAHDQRRFPALRVRATTHRLTTAPELSRLSA